MAGNRSLGTLTLDLIAKIGGFEKGMDQAARVAKNRMKEIENSAKNLAGLLGIGFGARAFVNMIKGAIDAADSLKDLRQQSGLTYDEMQALGNIAAKSGSSFEDIIASANKFNKAIAIGAGSSTKALNDQALAFSKLGISIDDLKTLTTGQLFDKAAKSLSSYADDQNKTLYEMTLFGKAGAGLTSTMNELGKTGLDPLIKRMSDLGILMSEQTIDAADEFNDKLVDAHAISDAFKRQIAVALLPTLTNLVTRFNDSAGGADTFKNSAEGVASVIKGLALTAIVVKGTILSLGKVFGGLAGVTSSAFKDVKISDLAGGPIGFGAGIVRSIAKNRKEIVAGLSGMSGDVKDEISRDWDTATALFDESQKKVKDDIKETDTEVKKHLPNLGLLSEAQKGAGKASDEWDNKLKQARKTLGDLAGDLEEQVAMYQKNNLEIIKYRLSVGDLSDEVKDLGAEGKGLADRILSSAEKQQLQTDTEEITKGLKGLDTQLKELSGDDVGAALDNFDESVKELLDRLKQAKNYAGIAQVYDVRDVIKQNAELNDILKERDIIDDDASKRQEQIQTDQEIGILGEIGGLKQADDMRKQQIQRLQGVIDKLHELEAAGSTPAIRQALKDTQHEMDELGKHTDTLAQKINNDLGDEFKGVVKDFLKGTSSLDEAFAKMGEHIIDSLIDMAAEWVKNELFAAFKTGSAGGSAGSGGIGGFLSGISDLFGGFFADGGRPPMNKASWVGEEGPELWIPDRPGRIVPSDQLSTGNIEVNIHEDASKAGRVSKKQNAGKTQIEIFVADIRGGGDMSRALEATYPGLGRGGS